MRIVVLVKQVPDTEEPRHLDLASGDIERSGDDVIDEITERAIAWRCRWPRPTRHSSSR